MRKSPLFYKYFILLLFIASTANTLALASNTGVGLNIIYILVDDLGYGDLNLKLDGVDEFSNPHIKTPNLSRFAHESLVFKRHYAAAPTCSPSRAGLLTGRTPTRLNINRWINGLQEDDKYFLSVKEVTFAEVLKENGYQTAIIGKWHLNGANWMEPANWTGWTGSFPNQQGFDYAFVEEGIIENTIIFFSSDNGPEVRDVYWGAQRSYGTSYPLVGQKRQLYEGGIRVPGMVRWPGKIKHGITNEPNSHIDVLPTLAELTDAVIPEGLDLDGTSIVQLLLANEKVTREKPLYWQNELIGQEWEIAGNGYDRRYVGPKPIDLPVPKMVTVRDSYVLRGYTEGKEEQFKKPTIFQLYNVDKDQIEKVELSAFEPELYSVMKKELLEMWVSVQNDRKQIENEINKKIDQRQKR